MQMIASKLMNGQPQTLPIRAIMVQSAADCKREHQKTDQQWILSYFPYFMTINAGSLRLQKARTSLGKVSGISFRHFPKKLSDIILPIDLHFCQKEPFPFAIWTNSHSEKYSVCDIYILWMLGYFLNCSQESCLHQLRSVKDTFWKDDDSVGDSYWQW